MVVIDRWTMMFSLVFIVIGVEHSTIALQRGPRGYHHTCKHTNKVRVTPSRHQVSVLLIPQVYLGLCCKPNIGLRLGKNPE